MSGSLTRLTQRRNGEIIIQTLMSMEDSTFKNIVAKICDDNNIIYEREQVTAVVKSFLRTSYYYGYLQLNFNGAFKLNEIIVKEQQKQKHPAKKTLHSFLKLKNMKKTAVVCDAASYTNKVVKKSPRQMNRKRKM